LVLGIDVIKQRPKIYIANVFAVTLVAVFVGQTTVTSASPELNVDMWPTRLNGNYWHKLKVAIKDKSSSASQLLHRSS
jgi:hypothetical protein